MKAAVYYAPDDIRLNEVPHPEIGEGELLVRVVGVGLCGSDIDNVLYGTARPGSVLGHDVVGEVAEVGPGTAAFSRGQRVALAHHISCMDCHFCRHGSFSRCDQFRTTTLDPGGFAEFC
jgi:L-iditol 2-dehydrogenase